MTDITMHPAGGGINPTTIKRDSGPGLLDLAREHMGWLIAGLAALLMLVFISSFWWGAPAKPAYTEISQIIQPGQSLSSIIGDAEAINVAEAQGLPIEVKLISSTLSSDGARRLLRHPTDVVRMRIPVFAGDGLSYKLDKDRNVVHGSVVYTPLRYVGNHR